MGWLTTCSGPFRAPSGWLTDWLAQHGHAHVVEWLLENKKEESLPNPHVFDRTAATGHLNVSRGVAGGLAGRIGSAAGRGRRPARALMGETAHREKKSFGKLETCSTISRRSVFLQCETMGGVPPSCGCRVTAVRQPLSRLPYHSRRGVTCPSLSWHSATNLV